jgi:hypothetical protein
MPLPGIDGAWELPCVVRGLRVRSTAVRLADGSLVVVSPVRGMARSGVESLGRPSVLVAPNHFHNRGLAEWAAEYPGAVVVASAKAAPRVHAKCGLPVEATERLSSALLPGHAVLVPPGTRGGETWLSLTSGNRRAWVVGDAFFSLPDLPAWPMGLVLRLLGIAPGLRIGTSFRWLLSDRATYRTWLSARLEEERPNVLVPCHGDVIADDALADRLGRLAAERLG